MKKADKEFLKRLLSAPGASSFESKPAALWREQAQTWQAEVSIDSYGNSFAHFRTAKATKASSVPRFMLAGHIDEIGLIISYIDDEGLLYFKGIGGWDVQQLIGQRVRIVGYRQECLGVIGKKPIHLMSADDRKKIPEMEHLWIDIGAKNGKEAKQYVRAGDFAVIEQPYIELLGERIVSKAIDNRIGAYIVLEAARRAAALDVAAEVVAVATVQEEIGGIGAYVASYRLEPDYGVAVDVTHATDVPGVNKKQEGDTPLGSGVQLTAGSYVHRETLAQFIQAAEEASLPYSLGTAPRNTYTDADDMAKNRHGVPTVVLSVPNRYMHSPNEMIDLADVEVVISLIVAGIARLAA